MGSKKRVRANKVKTRENGEGRREKEKKGKKRGAKPERR